MGVYASWRRQMSVSLDNQYRIWRKCYTTPITSYWLYQDSKYTEFCVNAFLLHFLHWYKMYTHFYSIDYHVYGRQIESAVYNWSCISGLGSTVDNWSSTSRGADTVLTCAPKAHRSLTEHYFKISTHINESILEEVISIKLLTRRVR